MIKEALYWERRGDKVRCLLCPRGCLIKEGDFGFCRARINRSGKLYTRIYGECSSVAVDPIEKKPLYHFYPGSMILSLGTVGCSFSCQFCQNFAISQKDAPTRNIPPLQAVEMAKGRNSIGIAYTYSEPLIWYEYVLDTARLAKEQGLKNVLVTNGFINEAPMRELLPYIDAINLDVKSSDNSFYQKYCNGKLPPVLNVAMVSKGHVLLEITNLIIPGLNDSDKDINDLVDWIAEYLGTDIPLHLSRYFPHYKMTIYATPLSTLFRARDIAKRRLKYVYVGNVLDEETNTSFCPNCKGPVIIRSGYEIKKPKIKEGKCEMCGGPINIVMDSASRV